MDHLYAARGDRVRAWNTMRGDVDETFDDGGVAGFSRTLFLGVFWFSAFALHEKT